MILSDAKERDRFLKFALVGAIGAVIDFGVMNLLTHQLNLSLVPAGTISFICAVVSNFIWNRLWTYPESRLRPVLNQLGMFFTVNAAGVAFRIPTLHFLEPPLLSFLERFFHTSFETAELLAKNLTLAAAVGIVMLWNFFVNRYWTYNGARRSDAKPNFPDSGRCPDPGAGRLRGRARAGRAPVRAAARGKPRPAGASQRTPGLAGARPELERLRVQADELERLRKQTQEIHALRAQYQEAQRLREQYTALQLENDRLKLAQQQSAAQYETLRAQVQSLVAARPGTPTPPAAAPPASWLGVSIQSLAELPDLKGR